VKFDALKPVMRLSTAERGPFRSSTQIPFQWDQAQRARTPTGGLLLIYPTDSPHARQAQVVPM
jgi:hypothetical protein